MRFFFLSLVLVFIIDSITAQTTSINALAYPTSNNTFSGRPGSLSSIGVDYYTGTALITVPVCNLASKELNIPVSLDYADGRGVREQEYATCVGLGWQLNAGGSISRVVRGFPDDQPNGYLGTGQWGKIVTTAVSTGTQFSTANELALEGITVNNGSDVCSASPTADGEPDIFYIKTPFFAFQFVFDQNGNPVFSNYNGYKIITNSFVNTTSYLYSTFEVIDDKGNQFYFGTSPNSTEQIQDSLYGSLPLPFISTWYLSKIITYNSNDVITFNYTAATANDITYNYSWSEIINSAFQSQTTLSTGKTIITQPKFISSIVSSLGEIDFTYSYTRLDDPNVPMLSSMLLKAYNPPTYSTSTVFQTYNLSYGYFGSPSTDPNVIRLQLNAITVTGNTTATSTPLTLASFVYNNTASLPNRTLPFFDYFGYCTPVQSPVPDLSLINRNPNVTTAQAGILNSITTLQGSTWDLFYELNAYGPSGSNAGAGLRVKELSETLPTGESLVKTYSYVDANNNSTGEVYANIYSQLSLNFLNNGSLASTLYYSGSPYVISDINGNIIGYSSVRETDQNGGYTVYSFTNFTNFNDFPTPAYNIPDIPIVYSSTSLAYKRGLPLSIGNYTSGGVLVTLDSFYYSSQTTQINTGYALRPFNITAYLNSLGGDICGYYGTYSTPVDNYQLSQTVHYDYDQKNASNTIGTRTNYGYHIFTPNLCLVNSINSTDSKGQTTSESIYYPDQNATGSIPMVNGTGESTALAAMVSANRLNVQIHKINTRNNAITQLHNTYAVGAFSDNGIYANSYLAQSTSYNTVSGVSTQSKQELYNFDGLTGNLISSNRLGSKSTAISYGYNAVYPLSKTVNASSVIAYQQATASGSLNIPIGINQPQYATITNAYAGTITATIPNQSFLGATGGNTCYFSVSLNGPVLASGSICISSVSGYTCSVPSTISFSNMPVGTYTLTVTALTNTVTTTTVQVNYTYQSYQATTTNEFFFEGFEQNSSAISGSAHTGNMYYNGNYTVPYSPPNSRSYVVQYWNLSGGVWNFNEVPYTTGMVLTGPVDDVRVFPTDALMTSYTYNPLVGKTSETDPSGNSTIYQYDGLNRLQTVRDLNNNILKQYDYEYQLLAAAVCNVSESGVFQKACSPGYIGSNVTYTVPACKYSSFISQAAANQLAINDVIANGQAYANSPAGGGTCTIAETISYTDTRTFQYTVTFTNNSTGLTYNFTANANTTSSTTLGQVPSGTYKVYICPVNNYTANNNYTVFGSTQTNVVCATFTNVSVTANGSIRFY